MRDVHLLPLSVLLFHFHLLLPPSSPFSSYSSSSMLPSVSADAISPWCGTAEEAAVDDVTISETSMQ